ncbi:MAG: hypothetical protein ACI4QI_05520, partial [Candidatus Coproplasma sp.]
GILSVFYKVKMARKKKEFKETTIENYYDLKVDKVDELVEALKSSPKEDVDTDNQPLEPISTSIAECTGTDTPDTRTKKGKEKHFDPYKIDKLSRVPVWIKASFIKFWFAGAVCYFVMFGLSLYVAADDLFIVCGLILGLLTDFIVNPIFRMLESDDKEYNNYMMFPFPVKVYWTFFTNLLYYVLVMFTVSYMYTGLNMLINLITGSPSSTIAVGAEPLLQGVFCVIADMAFIGIKDLIVFLVKRGKAKRALANGEVEIGADGQPVEGESRPKGRRKGGKGRQVDVAPETVETQTAEAKQGDESDVTAPATDEEADVDEIERLRRLAESDVEDKAKNSKNKKK